MTLISAAMRWIAVDALSTNVRIVNVITGEMHSADIAIYLISSSVPSAPGLETADGEIGSDETTCSS